MEYTARKEEKFVTPEELAGQERFASRILRENGAYTAETGEVKKAWVDCYGCQQNEADAEIMRGTLARMGYQLTDTAEEADVILINTCAIREHAESRVRLCKCHGYFERYGWHQDHGQ